MKLILLQQIWKFSSGLLTVIDRVNKVQVHSNIQSGHKLLDTFRVRIDIINQATLEIRVENSYENCCTG